MPRLPEYLKRPLIDTEKTKTVRKLLKVKMLNTVCEGARCPNKSECYSKNTATFLIMGSICTRNCRYCNIKNEKPEPLDKNEPKHIAEAVKELELKYAVITSVTRDDLPYGGAEHFKNCINEIRKISDAKIEILTPDFRMKNQKINDENVPADIIIEANPDVFNHNIETVKSLFNTVRPQGNYELSLKLLKYIKTHSDIVTKSGLMVGLGESIDDIKSTLKDLKEAGVDIVTIGQYIQPSKLHLPVSKYYSLAEYEDLKQLVKDAGFKNFQVGPLVRSSYQAMQSWQNVCENK